MEIADVIQRIFTPGEGGGISPEDVRVDAAGEVNVRAEPRGQIITFSGSFLYLRGSSTINVGALPVLNAIARVLREGKERIWVEGHAEKGEAPIDPRQRDPWDLSAARAVNVLKYLIQEGKIRPSRLVAIGYGDTRPSATGDEPRARERNRRVEVILAKDEQTAKP